MMLTKPLSANSLIERRGLRRLFVVLAERVRQPGVGVAAHIALDRARQVGEVRTHFARAERAVEADAERLRVLDRQVERIERLARERAAAAIGQRRRHHQRQAHAFLFEHLVDRDERRLGVQRVDLRFDQQQIRAAVDQPARLVLERVAHLVEGDGAKRRIVDVGRDRQRLGGRPERAGDEARLVGCLRGPLVGDAAAPASPLRGSARRRSPRARSRACDTDVELKVLVSMMSAPASRYSAWISAITSGRVSTSTSLLPLRSFGCDLEALAAEVGLGQLAALHHGAHRAIEDEDAFGEQSLESVGGRHVMIPDSTIS